MPRHNHRAVLALFPLAALALGSCSQPPQHVSLGAADAAGTGTVVATPGILSEEDWSFGEVKGSIVRTEHYRIYTTEKNPVIKSRMITFVEYALAHYRTALAPLPVPPQRLDTYLMDNRPQWERLTQRLMPDQAGELTRIQRGGYAFNGIGVYYDLGLFDTLAIAAHEGWHQYTQRTFKDPLPTWLEEGIAVYMEGHRWVGGQPSFIPWANLERFDQLRKAASRDRLMTLSKLLRSKPQDFLGEGDSSLLDFYAHLWALAHFINSGEGGKYNAGLRKLLDDCVDGGQRRAIASKLSERAAVNALATRGGPAVFQTYFNDDLDAAEQEFAAFTKRLIAPGTRDQIVQGREPADVVRAGTR
ncbi:MAG: DUF1570 domain-containing protein [Phycisphaerales bacterium]